RHSEREQVHDQSRKKCAKHHHARMPRPSLHRCLLLATLARDSDGTPPVSQSRSQDEQDHARPRVTGARTDLESIPAMKATWSRAAARVVPALVLGMVLSAGVVALSWIGAFAGWETRAVDVFMFLRDPVPAPGIAIVLIDDEAFRALGERQPLSRVFLAELADFLLRSGARVVRS